MMLMLSMAATQRGWVIEVIAVGQGGRASLYEMRVVTVVFRAGLRSEKIGLGENFTCSST
jgi:hypothetical protein